MGALKNEDIFLRKASSKFDYHPSNLTGGGIYALYENHIQYILFRSLLKE